MRGTVTERWFQQILQIFPETLLDIGVLMFNQFIGLNVGKTLLKRNYLKWNFDKSSKSVEQTDNKMSRRILTWLQYPKISSSNSHSSAVHSLDRKFCDVVSVGVFPGPRSVCLSFDSLIGFLEPRLDATSVPAKHSLIECFMSLTNVVNVFDIHFDSVFKLQNI